VDILFLLIPLSSLLLLAIVGVFAWALHRGQFEQLEGEGARILFEPSQDASAAGPEELTLFKKEP
jgi:cbb3-type cytochrome oxidase maturation protein